MKDGGPLLRAAMRNEVSISDGKKLEPSGMPSYCLLEASDGQLNEHRIS